MKKGMEVLDCDGSRVLVQFEKVLTMELAGNTLFIWVGHPSGVAVKIRDQKEVNRVWCEYHAWLTGPQNP